MPNTIWTSNYGKTFSGTTSKGGQIAPQMMASNSLVKATITLTNNRTAAVNYNYTNVTSYSGGSFSVAAGETVTKTILVDVKTQRNIGQFGSNNATDLSTEFSGKCVGFIWGMDYRYCHDGGHYNLNGLSYESAAITLLANEAVPQVLASNGVGSAVGQIRVDANGNLQMYNGTAWKQINNS